LFLTRVGTSRVTFLKGHKSRDAQFTFEVGTAFRVVRFRALCELCGKSSRFDLTQSGKAAKKMEGSKSQALCIVRAMVVQFSVPAFLSSTFKSPKSKRQIMYPKSDTSR
jgi:hypothetical protein